MRVETSWICLFLLFYIACGTEQCAHDDENFKAVGGLGLLQTRSMQQKVSADLDQEVAPGSGAPGGSGGGKPGSGGRGGALGSGAPGGSGGGRPGSGGRGGAPGSGARSFQRAERHPPKVPHDGIRVLHRLPRCMVKSSTALNGSSISTLLERRPLTERLVVKKPSLQTARSFLQSSSHAPGVKSRKHRTAFACAAGCSHREPQLEKSLAPWADWKENSSGLAMLDAVEGFCKQDLSVKDAFVMLALWKGEVYVKPCRVPDLSDETLYLVGPEDLSLVLTFLLAVTHVAKLPNGPIAFGMYLSDYTSLLDRHLVGPGLPIFAYLGRDTSWVVPWPSSFNVFSALDMEEWRKTQNPQFIQSADHAEGTQKPGLVVAETSNLDGVVLQKPWEARESKAFWIGAVTGPWEFSLDAGLLAVPRLKLLKLTKEHPEQLNAEYSGLASYGISWVRDDGNISGFLAARPRSVQELTGATEAKFKPVKEWANFKYYINLDGVVLGGRLSKLLSLGGVVLQQEAGYSEHITGLMKPYVHYVPIEYDLSDLVAKVEWLQRNDKEAKRIAANGKKLAEEHMRLEDHLCYVWRALEALGKKTASAKVDEDVVAKRLTSFRHVPVQEGGMRPTLEAFWKNRLEDVKTGDRQMSARGIKALEWAWHRFEALYANVAKRV